MRAEASRDLMLDGHYSLAEIWGSGHGRGGANGAENRNHRERKFRLGAHFRWTPMLDELVRKVDRGKRLLIP